MGVSLNGGTPNLHPKMIIFSRKTHGCWGNPPFKETPIYYVDSFVQCWYISNNSAGVMLDRSNPFANRIHAFQKVGIHW